MQMNVFMILAIHINQKNLFLVSLAIYTCLDWFLFGLFHIKKIVYMKPELIKQKIRNIYSIFTKYRTNLTCHLLFYMKRHCH